MTKPALNEFVLQNQFHRFHCCVETMHSLCGTMTANMHTKSVHLLRHSLTIEQFPILTVA